jgi:hypothetical protein
VTNIVSELEARKRDRFGEDTMQAPAASISHVSRRTGALLCCGAVAGPLYLLIGFGQASVREGFDVSRHPLSILSNGDLGWIQIANFLVSGALVIAGAYGVRQALRTVWSPALLGLYGFGLVGAGLFPADPVLGFPPGAPPPIGLSTNGLLHFVFGGVGFYALIGACFVFARRFARDGRTGWAIYSASTGLGFFAMFAAIASGQTSPAFMLGFYAAITWIWLWHTALYLSLLRDARTDWRQGHR